MKIKIANLVWGLGSGGIEAVTTNLYKYMDREKIEMDFIIDVDDSNLYDEFLKKYNVMKVPIFSLDEYKNKKFYKLRKAYRLIKLFQKYKYDIVYNNVSYPSTLFYGFVAKVAGVKKVITHAHDSGKDNISKKDKIKNTIFRILYNKFSNYNIAVSKQAGVWEYGHGKFEIIPNGIEINKFFFSDTDRNKIRNKLGIVDEIVLGNVGRLTEAKNQFFLLEILKKYKEEHANVKLLIVGEGELEKSLIYRAKDLGVAKDFILQGYTDNVNEFLSAMDVFLFPSLHEGFGIVAIEAQVNGLSVIASLNVPDNTKITDNIIYEEMDKQLWCDKIEEIIKINRARQININQIRCPIDIKVLAKKLEKIFVREVQY